MESDVLTLSFLKPSLQYRVLWMKVDNLQIQASFLLHQSSYFGLKILLDPQLALPVFHCFNFRQVNYFLFDSLMFISIHYLSININRFRSFPYKSSKISVEPLGRIKYQISVQLNFCIRFSIEFAIMSALALWYPPLNTIMTGI